MILNQLLLRRLFRRLLQRCGIPRGNYSFRGFRRPIPDGKAYCLFLSISLWYCQTPMLLEVSVPRSGLNPNVFS